MKKMILAVVVAGARMATASLTACPSGGEAACSDYTSQYDCDNANTYQIESSTTDAYTCQWYESGSPKCAMANQCDPQANPAPPSPGPPGNPTTAPGNPPTDFCNAGQSSTGDSYNVFVKETVGDMHYSRCCTDNTATDCYGSEVSDLVGKDIATLTNEQAASLCRASSLCGPHVCCNYNEELGHVVCSTLPQYMCPTRLCKPTSDNLDPGYFGRLQEDGCFTCQSNIPGVETVVLSETECVDIDDPNRCEAAYQTKYHVLGINIPRNRKCVFKNGVCQPEEEECTSAATATQSSTLLVAISVAVIAYELIKE